MLESFMNSQNPKIAETAAALNEEFESFQNGHLTRDELIEQAEHLTVTEGVVGSDDEETDLIHESYDAMRALVQFAAQVL